MNDLELIRKIRKIWRINPKTRVKPKKRFYNRAKEKESLRKELKRELYG